MKNQYRISNDSWRKLTFIATNSKNLFVSVKFENFTTISAMVVGSKASAPVAFRGIIPAPLQGHWNNASVCLRLWCNCLNGGFFNGEIVPKLVN